MQCLPGTKAESAQHFHVDREMDVMNRNQEEQNRGNNIPENDPSKAMDSKKEVEQSPDPKTDQDFPGYPHYPAREDIMDQRTDSHRIDVDVENLPANRNATGVSQRFRPDEDKRNTQTDYDRQEGEDYRDIGPRTEITGNKLDTTDSKNAEIGIPQNTENRDLNTSRPGTDLQEEDDSLDTKDDSDVSDEERMVLDSVFMPTDDEESLRRSALDNTDFEGDALNEDGFGKVLSSADLDIPEETDETFETAMGQGDEENKYYSLGGDRHGAQEEDPYSGPDRGQS